MASLFSGLTSACAKRGTEGNNDIQTEKCKIQLSLKTVIAKQN